MLKYKKKMELCKSRCLQFNININIQKGVPMINNNQELEEYLYTYCKEKGIDPNMFEIARVGRGTGVSERKVLYGPKKH